MGIAWAMLMAAVGALILIERAHYTNVYSRALNWGPFRMQKIAISRLVLVTGVALIVIGVIVALMVLRQAANL